jgi:integrase
MPLMRRDGVWYIRITHDGRQHWRSLRTRIQPARATASEVEAALWREVTEAPSPAQEPTAVDALVDDFLLWLEPLCSEGQHKRVAESLDMARRSLPGADVTLWTAERIDAHLRDGMNGEGWAEGRKRLWKARTAILHRQCINRFLGWCLRRGHVVANPVAEVEKPRVVTKYPTPPGKWDLVRVLAAARRYDASQDEPWLELAVRIAAGTGIRKGELRGITWKDVDLRGRVLRIPAEVSKSNRDRFVPLGTGRQVALKALEAVKKKKRKGRVIPVGKLDRSDNDILQDATEVAFGERIGFQRLRQWYCSMMAMAGVDARSLQELMGHRSITTTMKYYAAVPQRHIEEMVKRAAV